MSDEMAVSDNVAGDQPQVQSEDSSGDGGGDNLSHPSEPPTDSLATNAENASVSSQEISTDKDVQMSKEDDNENTIEENTKAEVHIDTQNNLEKSEKLNSVEESADVKLENSKETMDTEEKLHEEEMDTDENTETVDTKEEPLPKTEIKEEVQEEAKIEEQVTEELEKQVRRGIKRRASEALSDGPEEFKGFDLLQQNSNTEQYGPILDRLEAEVSAATKDFKPLRYVVAIPTSPLHASKRPRKDTDGSRPSSAMSSRSDETNESAALSPMQRGRRSTTEMSSPLLRVPLERGWKRELVYRAALDAHSRRHADIYYYMPSGKKLRSTREVAEHLSGTGLTLENFSFFKEPLGVDDPEKEIIRDAKLIRRVESPVAAAPPLPVEGKRTPKPKPPKGASPEPATPKSPPAKIKVKSVGSRLSGSAPAPAAAPAVKQPRRQQQNVQQQQQQQSPATQNNADNNNTAPWKKPSEEKRRGRIANGASPPPAVASAVPPPLTATNACPSPRRRGRPKLDDTDYFTAFYNRAQESNYNVVVQIFQYLGMRELAQCARVCRLWRQLAATPALWRHVRMKNSHVSSWAGLCSALRRHGTKRLDLRKMLLPQNDALFWSQFAENICTVNTLERIEMCRCPSSAVEAVCLGLPGLRALSALAIRDALLDPAPLGTLTLLHELRLKSMAGLSLTRDLAPLGALSRLQHLSLTSIKDLGWCACEVVGSLAALESLELGECSFRADMGSALARLTRLRRVRLERGPAHHAAPPVLRALASLPALVSLELVNVDVKVGFDDALAECKNIQRLLIIPTYVSQSATTNKQVLSGVLRLKETLTHLMWGVTIELLRVTELFIDQCEQTGDAKRRDVGECIPVLKPVPGCKLPDEHHHVAGPPQVEILPLPTLQRLLSAQMPNTKLKLLRIPFHATWRQSLADFQ